MRKQRNRYLPTRGVAIWHQPDDRGHIPIAKKRFSRKPRRDKGIKRAKVYSPGPCYSATYKKVCVDTSLVQSIIALGEY